MSESTSENKRSVLITGASGLVGSAVVAALAGQGKRTVSLVRRRPAAGTSQIRWDLTQPRAADPDSLDKQDFETVIHLAGDPVFGLWTAAKKARIFNSRVAGTRNLCAYLASLPAERRPKQLICASAIGFYGDRGDEVLTETSAPGTGFLADTCIKWEAAAQPARDAGLRVVHLRIGIVLASNGGALSAMLPAFRFGLGGRLGSGRQWMSWIALEDLVEIIEYAIEHGDLSGPVNAVAPNPVTNAQFTKYLADVLGRPAMIPVPGFALKMLPGGMAKEALLSSERVVPEILQRRKFGFQYVTLEHALQHAIPRE